MTIRHLKSSSLYQLRWIYLIALLEIVIHALLRGPYGDSDTGSYYRAFAAMLNGVMPILRTPVYPVFIGGLRYCFGENGEYFVVTIQILIFLISIKYLYSLAKLVGIEGRWPMLVALVYAVVPGANIMCFCIMTESLATSMMIFWLYCICLIWKRGVDVRRGAWCISLLVVMLLIRPAFIYLIGVMLAFVVAYIRKRKEHRALLSLCCAMPFVVYAGYCSLFYYNYKVFAPGGINFINQYCICSQRNILDQDVLEEGAFKEQVIEIESRDIPESIRKWVNGYSLLGRTSLAEANDYVVKSRNRHLDKYVYAALLRLVESAQSPADAFVLTEDCSGNDPFSRILYLSSLLWCLNLGAVYLTLLLYALMLMSRRLRQKLLALPIALIWLLIVCHVMVMIIGATEEWSRLFMPALPAFYLLCGYLLSCIRVIGHAERA